jgi:hypothetical protein
LFNTLENFEAKQILVLKELNKIEGKWTRLIPEISKIEEKNELGHSKANRIHVKPGKIKKMMRLSLNPQ